MLLTTPGGLQDISALKVLARCSGEGSLHEASAPNMTVEVYPQRHTLQKGPSGAPTPFPATPAAGPAGLTNRPPLEGATQPATSRSLPSMAVVKPPKDATKPGPAPGKSVDMQQGKEGTYPAGGPSPLAPAPQMAHARRRSRKKGHKKGVASPAAAPADAVPSASPQEAERDAGDSENNGHEEKHTPVRTTHKKKKKSSAPPAESAAPQDDGVDGGMTGSGGAREQQEVTPEVIAKDADTTGGEGVGRDGEDAAEKSADVAAAPVNETPSAAGQTPPVGNNSPAQQGSLQQGLQSLLPRLTLPNLPTAQTGLGALGGNFRWPFQLAAMSNGSGYSNVTYEELADALAANNGNWTAVAPLLAGLSNDISGERWVTVFGNERETGGKERGRETEREMCVCVVCVCVQVVYLEQCSVP
jgi:hypothetical protein